MLFQALMAITVVIVVFVVTLRYGVLAVHRHTIRGHRPKKGRPAVWQFGRWGLLGFAAALGVVAIAGAIFWPYPALYGPVLLLLIPMWLHRARNGPAKTPWVAPLHYGFEQGELVLYYGGGIATIIGIIRLSPDGG